MRGSRFGGSGLAGLEPIGDVRPQPLVAEPAHGLAQLDVLRCQQGVEVEQSSIRVGMVRVYTRQATSP